MKNFFIRRVYLLVVLCCLGFWGLAMAGAVPTILSTIPVNGETGVSRSLTSVTITFSEPMETGSCGSISSGFGRTSCSWSADSTVLTLVRDNVDDLLAPNITVTLKFNTDGMTTYRDLEGNPLAPFTLTFSTAGIDLEKIEADAGKGFFWPYFLYKPPTVAEPPVLLVEPNNTGTTSDDPAVHEAAARNLINWRSSFADDLQVPLLVPVFPRPAGNWQVYTHALDRDSLTTTINGIERLDLQLIAMINDARQRLAARDITLDSRVFLNGYSASGSFVNRFALLHPELVKAAASGSPGGWPTVPSASWEGQELIYPVGIADLEALTGVPFDLAGFQAVPVFIYIGDADNNDAVPYSDGFSDNERELIYQLFGAPPDYPYVRWPKAEGIYTLAATNTQFHIYPDIGHTYTDEMWEDLERFFSHYRESTSPLELKEKPLRYTIYFPHVACDSQWQTEIGITSNLVGIKVQGELRAFDRNGAQLGTAVNLILGSLGRVEVDVAETFAAAEDIAYLAFAADSFYISGYNKFFQPGNRVAIAATPGSPQGIFMKKERQGWTGIAFINPGSESVSVTLKAISDSGEVIAINEFTVSAGAKIVGLAEALFTDNITNASYLRFQADGNLIGFSLNGSADDMMLDGLPAMMERIE